LIERRWEDARERSGPQDYIIAALALNDGNQTQTAEQLEIGGATLYRKLKSYGLIGKRQSPGRA